MRRVALLLLLPLISHCSRPGPTEGPAPDAQVIRVSLIATNDVHGRLELLPFFAGYVDAVRARAGGGVLLVDAGDAFQGTIESNLNEGAAVVAAFNELGYAALAIGNHEFDFGPEGPASTPEVKDQDPHGALKARMREARFPFLSANLLEETKAYPNWQNLRRATLTSISGVKVGIVGGLTEEAESVIKRKNFAGLDVGALSTAVSREALELRAAGAEIVIAAVHAGGRCTRFEDPRDLSSCEQGSELFELARALPANSVDALVGGHRDQGVAHFVSGIPVVHVPSHLEAFSRVDISYDRGSRRVVDRRMFPPNRVCESEDVGRARALDDAASCKPGIYEGKRVTPNSRIAAIIRPTLEKAQAMRKEPIGVRVASAFIANKRSECALGNLFVDLMRGAVPKADLAFANGGSLRDDLPEGELTFGALHRAMPFDNQIATIRLTGAELRALLAANVSQQDHGLISISGIRARIACSGGRPDITLSREDGRPIRDAEELLVVTNDFVAMGGDGLLESIALDGNRVNLDTGPTVRDALIAGMRTRKEALRNDDLSLFDPKRPRIELPGPLPLPCR